MTPIFYFKIIKYYQYWVVCKKLDQKILRIDYMASIFAQKRFLSSLTDFFLKFQNLAQFVRLGSKFLCVSSILTDVHLLNSNMGSQFPPSLNFSVGLNQPPPRRSQGRPIPVRDRVMTHCIRVTHLPCSNQAVFHESIK